MSKVIDRKMSKLAEKMAKIQQELAILEAQKADKLTIDNDDIRHIAQQIRTLAKTTGEHVNLVATLVVKAAGAKLGKTSTTTKRTANSNSVAIKYRDPENSTNTWTGRGLTPKWLKTYEAQGRSRQEFTV